MKPHGNIKNARPARDVAEAIAIDGLGFIAADTARLQRFLDLSGLAPDRLREAAASPHFLPSVLDYLAADESLLLAFAAETGHAPQSIATARTAFDIPYPL